MHPGDLSSLARKYACMPTLKKQTPQDTMIYEQERKAVTLVRVELINQETMEHFGSDIIAFYQLILDEGKARPGSLAT